MFYQIEIEEGDRPKTSFVTPVCQRQYRRLPFGFASSQAIFQRMADMLLGGMEWVFAAGYINDIVIRGLTFWRTLGSFLRRCERPIWSCTWGSAPSEPRR